MFESREEFSRLCRLDELVRVDPESLSMGTDPDYRFRYIDISAAENGTLTIPDTVLEYRDAPSRARRLIQDGDVLMSTVRPNLKAFAYCELPPDNYVASTGFAVLRPKEGTDPRFVLYALLSDELARQLDRYVVGSNYPAINSSDVKRLRLPRFTFPCQERVGTILGTVDEAIAHTEALIAKTRQIKAGLMHDLFTRGVTPDGQLRPPREEAPELYKESPLGWIPESWGCRYLMQAGLPHRAHIKTGPFGSSLKLEHWVEEGVPVITIGALGEGTFLRDELLYVSEQTARRLGEYRVQDGDIVFSRVADVGRSAVITESEQGWVMSSNLMRISLDPSLVTAAFVQAQLAYDHRIRRQIRSTVNSGGRDVANAQILNKLLFAWPPLDEQKRTMARLHDVELKRRTEEDLALQLGKMKFGLMQDLLTGRVQVNAEVTPQPAEAAAGV